MNYLKKLNINFLLALIIPSLILGPFLSDVIISLSSLVFLIYLFKKKIFNYFNKKVVIIFFVFCLYCILVSIFFAKNRILSFESSLFYFRIGTFACLIWYLIEQDKKILSYFYYMLLICFSFLAFDGYFQFFFGFNIIGLPVLSDRISSFFRDELILGSYLSRLFPLLFALFLLKKKNSKFEVYYIGFLFIIIDLLIYIAGERASFFFLNLSTLFIILFIKKHQKFRLFTFVCSLVLIAGLTFSYNKFFSRMIFDTVKGMGFLDKQEKFFFSASHDSLISTAYNMFLNKPIFGHGPKMFRVICKDEKYAVGISPCDNHPHNFYVQLLAETGIIGFSFLFSVFAYVLYCAYRQFKSIILRQKRCLTDYQVCLLAGILITVWPLTTNGNFFNNWLMIVYSLPVGFYLHSIYGKNRKNISF
jgi:O-antigen ligase